MAIMATVIVSIVFISTLQRKVYPYPG
jgi:hypothetical protein